MREIKFKAWDKELKRMCDVVYIDFSAKEIIVYHADEEERSNWLKLDRFILLQYTGKKDKNGKEIYGGDIVKDKSVPVKGVVEFGNFTHYDYPEYGYFVKDKENINFPLETYDIYFKIIGNKYENPELLKEVNNENITK